MEYSFNVEKETENAIEWIKDWFSKNGNTDTKAVLGISGGKDSTVVAGLLCKALGKERVIGVLMPNDEQKDISDSIRVCNHLDIKNFTVNIGDAYKALTEQLRQTAPNGKSFPPEQYSTNTPARLRMTTLYGVGAMIGNCRIVNTSNLSEGTLGWGTYGGDVFGDMGPICNFTTEEVVAIGDYLGLPYDLTHKTPSDGMCGSSDEVKLGFTYHETNEYIRKGLKGDNFDKIMTKYKFGKFKSENINFPKFKPNLPNFFNLEENNE